MNNKTALVTGGTDGVGLSVVRAMVKKNYDVYFIGSNIEKGKKLEVELKTKAGNEHKAVIEFIQLDLSNLKAVKIFADSFLNKAKRLDVLLFSAGIVQPARMETTEGFERTFAVGYLSAFILSKALLPLLEKSKAQSGNARVLTVSGGGPIVLKERLKFDDLNFEKGYVGYLAAMRTVHAKVVLSQILAEQWADKGIASNTFHPGIVKGSLGRSFPWPLNVGFKVASQFMPRDSNTGIYVCLDEEINDVTGKFFHNKKQFPLKFKDEYKNNLLELTEAMLADIL